MKSYNEFFFFLQRPIYDKIPIDKIYCLRWAVYQKTDSNCPLVIFCFLFFFSSLTSIQYYT